MLRRTRRASALANVLECLESRCMLAADAAIVGVTFGPDLISPGASPSSLTLQLENYGPEAIPGNSYVVDLYLESDATGPVKFGEVSIVAPIASGGSAPLSFPAGILSTIVVPADMTPGEYSLLANLRRLSGPVDSNFGNNNITAASMVTVDSAGNSIDTARDLGALSPVPIEITEFVGGDDRDDWYRFTLPLPARLVLNVTGLESYLWLDLYRNGIYFDGTDIREDTSPVFAINLPAGSYELEATQLFLDTNYTLSLEASNQQADIVVDALSVSPTVLVPGSHPTAISMSYRNAGPGSTAGGLYVAKLWLSTDQTIDMADPRVLSNSRNADLSAGQTHVAALPHDQVTIPDITPGNYYILGNLHHVLGADPVPANNVRSAGIVNIDTAGTGASARLLGTLDDHLEVVEFVGALDTADHYFVDLPAAGLITLRIAAGNGVQVSVLNAGGDYLAYAAELVNGMLSFNAAAGRHIIRLSGAADAAYTLTLDRSAQQIDVSMQSASVSPTVIAPGGVIETFSGFLSNNGPAGLAGANHYVTLHLSTDNVFDDGDRILGTVVGLSLDLLANQWLSLRNDDAFIAIPDDVAPGNYYILARVANDDFTDADPTNDVVAAGTINIDAVPNWPVTAMDLGWIDASPASFTEFVGVGDTTDFYRVSTAIDNARFAISFDGHSAPIDVTLFTADSGLIDLNTITPGAAGAFVVDRLDPGSYYIRVRSGGGTAYTMTAAVSSPGTLALAVSTITVNEADGVATVTVQRTGGDDGAVSVQYATADGTALAGNDYTAVSGILHFADGQTSAQITIPLINDAGTEEDKTLALSLSSPGAGSLLGDVTSTVLTLQSDDVAVIPDLAPPKAKLARRIAPKPGTRATPFSVTYSDDMLVNAASIGTGDILIVGPRKQKLVPTLFSRKPAANASALAVTYRIIPPGKRWDAADNGLYTVYLMPKQVSDTAGRLVPRTKLGVFTIRIGSRSKIALPIPVPAAPARTLLSIFSQSRIILGLQEP